MYKVNLFLPAIIFYLIYGVITTILWKQTKKSTLHLSDVEQTERIRSFNIKASNFDMNTRLLFAVCSSPVDMFYTVFMSYTFVYIVMGLVSFFKLRKEQKAAEKAMEPTAEEWAQYQNAMAKYWLRSIEEKEQQDNNSSN
jgi:hypothetical protein